MENVTYVGLSSEVALRRQLEVVGNNLANMSTVGFKADRMLFDTALAQTRRDPEGQVAFVLDRNTYTDFSEGGLKRTDNPLDVAISGDGFFRVNTPDGPAYTRDGRMARDAEGRLVTLSGAPLLDDGGQPIAIPDDAQWIQVAGDGSITADRQQIARLGVWSFDDPRVLSKSDGLLFTTQDGAQPTRNQDARIEQGMVEESNVNAILEMTRMMDVTRAYERADRLDTNADGLIRDAVTRLGRVA
jgi:flagellar basal-body rod protein FlgF